MIQGNHRLARWPRWVQAWGEDRHQHAAARAEARAHAPIRPGERLVTVARGTGGELLVATDRAVYHQAGRSWARLGWEQVSRVHWDEHRRALILTGLTPAVPARTVLRLAKDWGLPAVTAERVSWTKVLDQRVSLNAGAGARVVVRCLPGQARLTWLVILDRGLDPANPGVQAELESALTELRAATGLEDAAAPKPGIAPRESHPGDGAIKARAQVVQRAGSAGVVQSRRGAGRRIWM